MTTEQTIPELLAQLEACTTYAEYMPLRSRVVQALDSYTPGVGYGEDRMPLWVEFERICSVVGPAIRKREYDSINTYSLDELAAFNAPRKHGKAA